VRVLIADDEKGVATVLADLVRSCDHDVVEVVHSGLDAIRSYHRHNPDVVLMDFSMSRLNGLTACRNILCSDPKAKIVFLSGMILATHLTPEYSGAVAFLQKPVAREHLQTVLTQLADADVSTADIAAQSPEQFGLS
jgi:CheY-like chemotaxis protein